MWTVWTGSDTRHAGLRTRGQDNWDTRRGGRDGAVPWEGGLHTHSRPRPTLCPPILRPHIWVGHRGLSTEPLGSSALPPRVVGRSLGPWHGAETLSSFLIQCALT